VRLRNHRVLDHPAVLDEHDHVSWCGPRVTDFTRLAAAAFDMGTVRNDRLILVGQVADFDQLRIDAEFGRLVDDGTLTVQGSDEVYGDGTNFDPVRQLETFTAVVDEALAQGYDGVRIVADNTPMITGDDDTFRRWLTWEQMADRFLAGRPVVGVCYFDDAGVDGDRLDVLEALHPLTHGRAEEPSFRLFVDNGTVVVTGEIDGQTIHLLREALATRPRCHGELVVDLGHADFIDHRTLQEFGRWATAAAAVELHGVNATLRRLWHVLDLATDNVRFV
jgi:hypothetical protein